MAISLKRPLLASDGQDSQSTLDSDLTTQPPLVKRRAAPIKQIAPRMESEIIQAPSVGAQVAVDVAASSALGETTASFGALVAEDEDAYASETVKHAEAFVALLVEQSDPIVQSLLAELKAEHNRIVAKQGERPARQAKLVESIERESVVFTAARSQLAAAQENKRACRKRFEAAHAKHAEERGERINAEIERHGTVRQEATRSMKAAGKLPPQDLGAILEAIKKAQAGAAGANDDDSDEESDAD